VAEPGRPARAVPAYDRVTGEAKAP